MVFAPKNINVFEEIRHVFKYESRNILLSNFDKIKWPNFLEEKVTVHEKQPFLQMNEWFKKSYYLFLK